MRSALAALGVLHHEREAEAAAPPPPPPPPLSPEQDIDAWLDALVAGEPPHRLRATVVAALARLPVLDALAPRLRARFLDSPVVRRELAEVLAARPAEPALLALIDAGLGAGDRECRQQALLLCGALARASRAAAARVARCAAEDRVQAVADAMADLPLPERLAGARASSGRVRASAVAASGCAALAPTARFELETARLASTATDWARALAATEGEAGVRYLLARMHRPGWSQLPLAVADEPLRRALLAHADPQVRLRAAEAATEREQRSRDLCAVWAGIDRTGGWVLLARWRERSARDLGGDDWAALAGGALPELPLPPSPLEAVAARDSDLRVAALDNLEHDPRPEHLLGLLLGIDLGRQLARRGYPRVDSRPERWLEILHEVAHSDPARRAFDRLLSRGPETTLVHQLRLVGAASLVDQLLEARVFPRTYPVLQRTTPDLEELYQDGAAAVAARFPALGLPPDERAALLAAEAALAAEAPAD